MIRNKCMNKLRVAILTILVVLVMCSASWAATYYVSATNGNDGNPGTLASPWKTIGKANATLKAGDTVYIRGGTYSGQQIYPSNSGTASNRITYRNYNDEKVTITQAHEPLLLSNRSYITIAGTSTQNILITNCDHYLVMTNGDYNELAYLTISKMRAYAGYRGFHIGENSSYNWVHHCIIEGYGYFKGGDHGNMIAIGEPEGGTTNFNLIEDCHFYHGGHGVFESAGKWNVVRNNYMHNEEWTDYTGLTYGNRVMISKDHTTGGKDGGWNLYEGNRICFTAIPVDADYASGCQCPDHDNIIRNNMFYACMGPGWKISVNSDAPYANSNYIYNNVFFYNGIGGISEARQRALWLRANAGTIDGTVVKNNIFYKNLGDDIVESKDVRNTVYANNWHDNDDGDPNFVNAVPAMTTDPFNQNYPDFNLKPGSPCIDSGAFLTQTTSSGSGTKIPVRDAHYFMDGWGIIEGDLIQLENQTQTARIINVDYNNNVLTVDKSLTWSANQGVSLQYSGSAPDIGAFENGTSGVSTLSPPTNFHVIGYN